MRPIDDLIKSSCNRLVGMTCAGPSCAGFLLQNGAMSFVGLVLASVLSSIALWALSFWVFLIVFTGLLICMSLAHGEAKASAARFVLIISLSLSLGLWMTGCFYRSANNYLASRLDERITTEWLSAEEQRITHSVGKWAVESTRAARIDQAPTPSERPAHITELRDVLERLKDMLMSDEFAERGKPVELDWTPDLTSRVNSLLRTHEWSGPRPAVFKVRDWTDPTSLDEQIVVSVGIFPDPVAREGGLVPIARVADLMPMIWTASLPITSNSKFEEVADLPRIATLIEANDRISSGAERGKIYFVGTGRSHRHGIPFSSSGDSPEQKERAIIGWHARRLAAWLGSFEPQDRAAAARDYVSHGILGVYVAEQDVVSTTSRCATSRVRLLASRAGSYGSSPNDVETGEAMPEIFVEVTAASQGQQGRIDWSSELLGQMLDSSLEEVLVTQLRARAEPERSEGSRWFHGLAVKHKRSDLPLLEFLTSPAVPSFGEFRDELRTDLRASHGLAVPKPADSPADGAPQKASPALDLVDAYRPVAAMGDLVLFRWLNGPIQWITIWIFFSLLMLLVWRLAVSLREACVIRQSDERLGKSLEEAGCNMPWGASLLIDVLREVDRDREGMPLFKKQKHTEQLFDRRFDRIQKADAKLKTLGWFPSQLGLLGTLIGLAAALGSSDQILSARQQLDAIEATQVVNGSMRVAFDTTIVGVLVTALFLVLRFIVYRIEVRTHEAVEDRAQSYIRGQAKPQQEEQ